jgi:glucose/arabinose dehydrogenase
MQASGDPEVIVDNLPTGGHWTRDIAFSLDGTVLYIAIGSDSNVAQNQSRMDAAQIEAFQKEHGVGAAWGEEEGRAVVLAADPDGKNLRPYATGLRNCSGLTVEPATGAPWCAVNERDGLGDNLPPDYATRVQEGGFYGWPWYYIGANEDPRHRGARPDLARYVVAPDILIQAHSAPLGIAFYRGEMFPQDVVGDAFVALHGSWNRGNRTGYKVVRLLFENGQPTGVYEDFLTGFLDSDNDVWGRPVGVAVAADGSLLVSEDGNGTIWRVSHAPVAQPAASP